MSFWDNLSKLPFNRGISIFAICFGNLIAPFQFIFIFHQGIFKELDIIKLILLSLSLGIPFTLLNYYSLWIYGQIMDIEILKEKTSEKMFNVFGISSALSAMPFYIPAILKLSNILQWLGTWTIVISSEFILFILIRLVLYFEFRGKKSHNLKNNLKRQTKPPA